MSQLLGTTKMANDPTLRLPREWEQISGIRIMDADGWDRKNYDVSWNTPINEAEWIERMSRSTCGFYEEGRMYMKNKTV